MIYQAIRKFTTISRKQVIEEVCFEQLTLECLFNAILDAELDSLPHYEIRCLNEDAEEVPFDDKNFMTGLRDAFDANLVDAHYAVEHNRSNRS